jgi:lipid-A-disaccharide synthase
MSVDFFIFAGEASGDIHGASLIKHLKEKIPSLTISAVAGPSMRKENIEVIMKTEDFQVMGLIDILFSFFSLMKKFFYLKKYILKTKPKIAVFIDYPGFNLRLERSLKKKGFQGKIVHYICPSVWAHGKKRIKLMEKYVDLLLTIFPFEKEIFKNTKVKAKYIGNPTFENINSYSYNKELFKEQYISIFPGSREQEIKRNLPLQLQSVKNSMQTNCKIAISSYHPKYNSFFNKQLTSMGIDNFIIVKSKDNYDLMKNTTLAIATSGTINLELALHNVPTIVTYFINTLDLFIVQKILKINLKYYCIVNIIENKLIFPELYGPNLSLDSLTSNINNFLLNKKNLENCQKDLNILKNNLFSLNPSKNAAKKLIKLLA